MDSDRTITVSEETARLIREKLDDGSFASAADVVEAAMDALRREAEYRAEDLAWIKAEIKASIEDTGPGYSSEEVFAEIRQRLEAKQTGGFHEEPAGPLE